MPDIPFFALTTRGLEFVTAQEITAVRGATITGSTYRRVAGSINGTPARLLNLKSADDVYLDVGTWFNVGSQRSALPTFTEQAGQLKLGSAVDVIRGWRRIGEPLVFSVTASFVGRRNYTADEIKQAVAAGVQAVHDWTYAPDDREADLNLRLFIDHETAYVGVRLAQRPLHERPYKTAQIAGSLKPSIAAALVVLAEVERGARLLDPFCGAGTIAAEAIHLGYEAVAGDISPEALAATRENAPEITPVRWDARQLPLSAHTFDAIVSNLPWGRQVEVDQRLSLLCDLALAEMRRVLKPDGAAVLLTSAPELHSHEGFTVVRQFEISLFGQRPTVSALRAR